MKFITDDVARHYARRVARMRAKQIEHREAGRGAGPASAELFALEDEVDRLTIAMLDDRSSLHEGPTGGESARETGGLGPSRSPSSSPS